MVIELRGVEFVNKGAELMLYAIIDQVSSSLPEVKFAMEVNARSPKSKLDELGIFEKARLVKKGMDLTFAYKLLPKKSRMQKRIVLDSEIDVVLDGSGFAFGDKWGAKKAGKRIADHIIQWKRQGKKTILLPQAFGPFTSSELQDKMKIILQNADLVAARDKVSLENLKKLGVGDSNLMLAPDFTNLISGELPDRLKEEQFDVAIIPNQKMLETSSEADNLAYPGFLREVIKLLQAQGRAPFFLIHEANDKTLADLILAQLEQKIPVVAESNPLIVKGIIGKCHAVITSRFHGLVSALSQGIPCLATGWSHKYEMLLEDYKYQAGLCSLGENENYYLEKITLILDPGHRERNISNLQEQAALQKKLSKKMWGKVFDTLKA